MTKQQFWSWFDCMESQMSLRAKSWRRTFEYLDTRPDPLIVVETGCACEINNWQGDGQSTVLLDRYVQTRASGSHVYSVDLDLRAVQSCQDQVSAVTTVTCGNSISWLFALNSKIQDPISLLYLDSYDVDWNDTLPSSLHHLKELAAIRPSLCAETLVVVDDSPIETHVFNAADDIYTMIGSQRIGGQRSFDSRIRRWSWRPIAVV